MRRDAIEPVDHDTPAAPAPEHLGMLDLMRESLAHSRRRVFGIARRLPNEMLHGTIDLARDPFGTTARLFDTVQSIGRALAPATAPMSPIMRGRGLGRRLEMFDISLDDMRRVAKGGEGSLNDVFVAAVIGGVAPLSRPPRCRARSSCA